MNIEALPVRDDMWLLTDTLGREVGIIVRTTTSYFIECDESSILEGIARGPHKTLDEAMALVEWKTGGQCRRAAP